MCQKMPYMLAHTNAKSACKPTFALMANGENDSNVSRHIEFI